MLTVSNRQPAPQALRLISIDAMFGEAMSPLTRISFKLRDIEILERRAAWDSRLASVNARVDELRKTLYTIPLHLRGGARDEIEFLEQWHRSIPEDKLKVREALDTYINTSLRIFTVKALLASNA